MTAHFLWSQDWLQAVVSTFFTACSSLWVKFSSKFMEALEAKAESLGEAAGQGSIATMDSILVTLRWTFSGFRGKYYQSLTDKCLKLKTEGFNIGLPALNLEKVFVPLKVANEIPQNIPRGIPSEPKPRQPRSRNVTAPERISSSQDIWHFLATAPKMPDYRRIVILAPPGSGKTTLLQHITLTYARNTHRQHRAPELIPVLLRLRDVRDRLVKPQAPLLNQLIREEVERLPACRTLNPPPNWFEKQLEGGRCLVMLDGLDEVASSRDRNTVSRWTIAQMERYPRARFVLTSRPHGYVHELFAEQVDVVLKVQPFTLAQMKQFIEGWYKQTEILQQRRDTPAVRDDAYKQAEDLIEALLQNPSIRKMASNPLLVTTIATVHYLGNALPGARVELYREICDVLLGRRLLAKKIQLPLNPEQNKLILEILALDLMERGTQKFTLAECERLIRGQLERTIDRTPEGGLTPARWLETLKHEIGLLVEKEVGSYEFAHLSFQEYLAAVRIKADECEDRLAANFNNPHWAETIRLYAALGDATRTIEIALQLGTVSSLSLGYDCLQEGKTVDPKIASRLNDILEHGIASSDPQIASMAAEVRLIRRLNQLLEIDASTAIDRSHITRAEYQLFVEDGLNAPDSRWFQPNTTPTQFAPQEANRTFLGISYENARSFCVWLSIRALSLQTDLRELTTNAHIHYYYRLPTAAEARETAARNADVGDWMWGDSNTTDNFLSKGIRVVREKVSSRYEKLANYLAAGEWRKADEETTRAMLQVAQREEEGWLRAEDIDRFPCTDLRTIDRLWVHYSQGRFGFRVQKEIYQSLGGTREYNREIWEAFGERVGWRVVGKWLYYSDLSFEGDAHVGHLPTGGVGAFWVDLAPGRRPPHAELSGGVPPMGLSGFRSLGKVFSRVETCKV